MGEVLRAILDFNSLDSRPAFYSAQITLTHAGGGFTVGRRQASIACKQDVFFLAMGASFDAAFVPAAGTSGWEAKAAALSFSIQRASNGESFSNADQPMVLQNYNLNNWVTWDEYVLFSPAELILINMDIFVDGPQVETEFSWVTLLGVEYRMKNGS